MSEVNKGIAGRLGNVPGRSGWSDGNMVAKVPMESGDKSTSFLLMSARYDDWSVKLSLLLDGLIVLTCIKDGFFPSS